MHPSLEILDILRLIVAEFHQVSSLKSLYAMALTCKTFLEPTLDVMWNDQYGLRSLLGCFPADAISPNGNTIRVLRPLLPEDWERPSFYAYRIRHYHGHDHDARVTNLAEVLDALSLSLAPGNLLLPALTRLTWWHHTESTTSFIRLFLSPDIQKIQLTLSSSLFPLLPQLPDLLQNLDTIRIRLRGDPVDHLMAGPPISSLIGNLTSSNLVSLDVPNAEWSDVAHLARLRRLKRLFVRRLGAPSSALGDQSVHVLPPDPFPSLRRLKLIGTSVQSLIHFFLVVGRLDLEFIWLNLPSLALRADTTALYTLISKCCSPSLNDFEHSIDDLDEEDPAVDVIAFHTSTAVLCELYSLRSLQRLSLYNPAGFGLDDQGIIQLARAFPQLEELILADSVLPDDQAITVTNVTLAGLRALAEHCPNLHHLSLSFDASVIPPVPLPVAGQTLTRWCSSTVAQLHILNSVLHDPIQVAKFLSYIFPVARISRSVLDRSLNDDWQTVADLMESFLALREEERAWAMHSLHADPSA
ncbi:hypothetical protein C8F01DRAFT_1244011 [Mycena amicta]|nr:hypothetical protein C8F01DRAFT_1244011 [Mycena amicta]